jgi:hypothetical protein
MDFLGWEEREKRRNRKLVFTGEEVITSLDERIQKPASAKRSQKDVQPQATLFSLDQLDNE